MLKLKDFFLMLPLIRINQTKPGHKISQGIARALSIQLAEISFLFFPSCIFNFRPTTTLLIFKRKRSLMDVQRVQEKKHQASIII